MQTSARPHANGIRPFFGIAPDADVSDLRLRCTVRPEPGEPHPSYPDRQVFVPRIVELVATRDGEIVHGLLDPATIPDLDRVLGRILVSPLHPRYVSEGAPLPEPLVADYDFGRCDVLVWNDARFYDALMRPQGDREAKAILDDCAWIRFRHSSTYDAYPCERDLFLEIRREFTEGTYLTGMSIDEYYRWFAESSAHLSDDGTLLSERRAEAERILDAWTGLGSRDIDSLAGGIIRNLEVHPRHEAIYEELARKRLQAAMSPSPSP